MKMRFMRNKILLQTILFLLCAAVFLPGCAHAARTEVPALPETPPSTGLRIAVASDLHLNPDSRPSGVSPAQFEFSLELADALFSDV